MRPLRQLLLVLWGASLGACSKKTDAQQTRPEPSASAAAVASAIVAHTGAADASSDAAPASTLAAVAARKIPAGSAPNGTWTTEFAVERVAGDENLDWPGAIAHCESKGKQLCLETQWQRACELDSEIGKLESWTLTADYPGAAVRGGGDCKTRSFKKISEKSETRAGLCCDRVVAISSEDKSDELRSAATRRILEVEAALGDLSPSVGASKLLFEQVSVDGQEYTRDLALLKLRDERKDDPGRRQFYDHCNVKMSDEPSPQLIADCGVVQLSLGKTRGFSQRIAFESATGPVVYLGDPKAMKPKERKERVNSFLPSE